MPSGRSCLVGFLVVVGMLLASPPPVHAQSKKAVAKCQAAIAKVTAKALAQRGKSLAACSAAAFNCVQLAGASPACLRKAGAKCAKQLPPTGQPDKLEAAVVAAIVRACGTLSAADLFGGEGLAFTAVLPLCADVGVSAVPDAAALGQCLARLHASVSEETVGLQMPRVRALTALAGVGAATVPDLPVQDGCVDCAVVPSTAGKAVTACVAASAKAAGAFLGKARGLLDGCATALVGCRQVQPTDQACFTKATGKCTKIPGELDKLRTKLVATVQGKCAPSAVSFAALQSAEGAGFGGIACECERVGAALPTSASEYAACLMRQHECRLATLASAVAPRFDGVLESQQLGLHDLLCVPPTLGATLTRGAGRAFGPFGSTIGKFVKTAVPANKVASTPPFTTRGFGPRVGAPLGRRCSPARGRTCHFRLPITKIPNFGAPGGARAAVPPTLVLAVQRTDGELAADHFELVLSEDQTEAELDVTYADDLAECEFELAFSVMEDGQVSAYTEVEQKPHPIPPNDACGAAREITADDFTDVLDVTNATLAPSELQPSCGTGVSSVWYRYTPPASGVLTIDSFGSDFDTVVSVVTDDCGAPSELECGNDVPPTLQSKVAVSVVAGVPYLIQVQQTGTPDADNTLYVHTHFVAAGEPPSIAKPVATIVELNGPSCSFLDGSLFRVTFDYTDVDGDVVASTAMVATTTADIVLHFTPSNAQGSFPASLESVTGDGFRGTASVRLCLVFNADTAVDVSVALHDLGGPGKPVKVKISRPPGAN